MNWDRGFFRVWVVFAVIWIGAATHYYFIDCQWWFEHVFRSGVVCFDDISPHGVEDFAWVFLPPTVVLLIGVTIAWCSGGFRPGA